MTPDATISPPPELPDPDLGEVPHAVPRGPIIRVLMPDNTVTELHMETYLRGVVPAEMPALWPMEALKAQATAARTYATYAIAHPHYDKADICTTTKTQAYDTAKTHYRTDAAITATANILIWHDGQPIQAFYSANCGGATKNNAQVWPGEELPYLAPVDCINFAQKNGHGVGLCQWGARDMAIEGDTYDQILHHYYLRVTLAPPTEDQPWPQP